jgi:uncharacterized membrane protein HdeD (DUF308 family)
MTALDTAPARLTYREALRRLYFVRFVFALVWALLLFTTADDTGPFLTTLLVIYPLVDAASVAWQIRADQDRVTAPLTQWINVVVSVAVAIALGVASTHSTGAALAVWGIWAITAGIPQLITAIRNRRLGGQVPQMLSGGISVLAGASFLAKGLDHADSMSGAGGYAILGGVFFLISAIRLMGLGHRAGA